MLCLVGAVVALLEALEEAEGQALHWGAGGGGGSLEGRQERPGRRLQVQAGVEGKRRVGKGVEEQDTFRLRRREYRESTQ